MDNQYKDTRTDALVVKLGDIASELKTGRGLNQIQLAIVESIAGAAKALDYSVNG